MLRYIALAIMMAMITPAYSASKEEVAAAGCKTFKQARKAHPSDNLKYRLIDDEKCWYSQAAFNKKVVEAPKIKRLDTAPIRPKPLDQVPLIGKPLDASPADRIHQGFTPLKTREKVLDDELDAIFWTLCGGPCPQIQNETYMQRVYRLQQKWIRLE